MWIFKTIVFKLIKLLFLLIFYIAKYKVFKKMGEKGWKALIPIYSEIVLFKKLKINMGFTIAYIGLKLIDVIITIIWFIFVIVGVLAIVSIIFYSFHDNIFDIADKIIDTTIYVDILVYLIQIYVGYVLALKFGKDKNTAIILGIINPIEMIMFGYGNYKYIGEKTKG